MASQIIGRTHCPECGFEHAHVKRNTEKGTVYRYCPEGTCCAQYFPKGATAIERLMAKTRPLPVAGAPAAPAAPAPAAPDPTASGGSASDAVPPAPPPPAPEAVPPAPAPRRKAIGLFGGL